MTPSMFNKNLLALFVILAPLVTWGKGTCYQATGPASQIVGATISFTATLWIHDTLEISDELIVRSGAKTATMGLWCRDMETQKCSVDAGDRTITVKESADKSEIEFTFPAKLRIKADGDLGFSAAGTSDRVLKLKKVDPKKCPTTTIQPIEIPPPPPGGSTGRG